MWGGTDWMPDAGYMSPASFLGSPPPGLGGPFMMPPAPPPMMDGSHFQMVEQIHRCEQLDRNQKEYMNRISKLERSKGQLNKDIQDMLKDVADWKRQNQAERATPTNKIQDEADVEDEIIPLEDLNGMTIEGLKTACRLEKVDDTGDQQTLVARLSAHYQSRVKDKSPKQFAAEVSPPSISTGAMSLPPIGLDSPPPQVTQEVDANPYRKTWRIERSKLKDTGTRQLVSQPFSITDMPELRLMVHLGPEEISGGQLSAKDLKSRLEALINEGPLTGLVKLKVVANCGTERLDIKFKLFVGKVVKGPFEHNFADRVTYDIRFEEDWLKEFENGAVTVGVEIMPPL